MILDFVIDSLKQVFHSHALPLDTLDTAHAFVLEQGFRNRFASERRVRSPSRDRIAYVAADQYLDAASIDVVVETKDGKLLKRIPVAIDSPDEFIFQRYFGKIKWLDNDRLTLTRVDGVELALNMHGH